MLANLLASIVIAQNTYVHLTPANKVAVERKIAEKGGVANSPRIAPGEITNILGIEPQCGQIPNQTQIRCTWTERDREIKAYWSEPWKFQRWESKGF